MIICIYKGIDEASALADLHACGIWPAPAGEPNPHYPPSMLGWAVEHPGTWQVVVTDTGPITHDNVAALVVRGWKCVRVHEDGSIRRLSSGVTVSSTRIEEWARINPS